MKQTSISMKSSMTYYEADYNASGAVCKTNKTGMTCPRCSEALAIDVEHKCGDMAENAKQIATKGPKKK